MYDVHVSLSGVPVPFDSHLKGVDLARVVRVEQAITAGLQALNDAAAAAVDGNGAVVPADAKRVADAKLAFSVKKDGKPFADGVVTWHNLTDAHAAFIGESFAAVDDAAAKG